MRLKLASELIHGSRQPLKPGILAHTDRLFSEADKPITSMPSHHNFNKLFRILNDSSASFFHDMKIRYREDNGVSKQSCTSQGATGLLNQSELQGPDRDPIAAATTSLQPSGAVW